MLKIILISIKNIYTIPRVMHSFKELNKKYQIQDMDYIEDAEQTVIYNQTDVLTEKVLSDNDKNNISVDILINNAKPYIYHQIPQPRDSRLEAFVKKQLARGYKKKQEETLVQRSKLTRGTPRDSRLEAYVKTQLASGYKKKQKETPVNHIKPTRGTLQQKAREFGWHKPTNTHVIIAPYGHWVTDPETDPDAAYVIDTQHVIRRPITEYTDD